MGLINKYNEENFKNKVRGTNHAVFEKYDSLEKRADYTNVNNIRAFSTEQQHIETRIGVPIAAPIDLIGDDNIDYTITNIGAQDKINLLPILTPEDDGSLVSSDGFKYQDLIKFKISVINPIDPDDVRVLLFRALLEDLSDDYTGGWNSYKYNGRAEKFYTYNEFDRKINFSFKIAAQSRQEITPLYQKLNYLVAQTAPEYSGNTSRMRGKFNRITIGDWINDIPGFFTSINLKWSKSYPWEINLEEGGVTQHPHVLDVSCQFQPIHDFAPENREFDTSAAPFILPGIENVEKGQVDPPSTSPTEGTPIVDTPVEVYNPDPFTIQPFVAEPDNTRVAMPQEPQFYPNFPINNSVGSNTQGNGGFAGGGFGGGSAGSDF